MQTCRCSGCHKEETCVQHASSGTGELEVGVQVLNLRCNVNVATGVHHTSNYIIYKAEVFHDMHSNSMA